MIALFLYLVSAPTNTLVKAPIDLSFPKTPVRVFLPDLQAAVTSTGVAKVFYFMQDVPGVIAQNVVDFGNRDLEIAKIPDKVVVGSRSIFYMKRGTNDAFVFTDNSRKNVFYGTIASGYPVINRIECGPFSEISDIHLSETASNTIANLLVADKGANTVYSYVLAPNSTSALCTSQNSVTVPSPIFIQSLTQASPVAYVGYMDSGGLEIRSYDSGNLSAISAAITLTSKTKALFGKPLFDYVSSELYLPIRFADDSVGSDYVVHYTNDLVTRTNIVTCRSPEQILNDFEGGSRYRYVFCPSNQSIQIYDASDVFVRTLPTGTQPVKMMVGSDGTNRFITILQSNAKLVMNKILISSGVLTTTTISLSTPMTDIAQIIGAGAVTDRAILISPTANTITLVNLTAQSVLDTYHLPTSITSLAAQSYTAAHFVSAEANSAYSLTEQNSSVWTARLFDVGTFPLQIGYRTNRLYTLNRDSDNLSVVNLSTRAVSNIATQTRPISMDFSTSLDRLWVANQTSSSVSLINITTGSEVAISNAALPFIPQKLTFQSSDSTVYVGGQTSVRALDATNIATISTQTLASHFSDIALSTGGVTISSKNGFKLYTMDRSTLNSATLNSPPHLLTSNRTTGVAGLLQDRAATTFAGLSQILPLQISRLFSNSTTLFAFLSDNQTLYAMPYSLFSSRNFPGIALPVSLDPQVTTDDGSGNFWMADSSRMKIQRLTPYFQQNVLYNLIQNRPEDIVNWSGQSKIYVALRDLDAVAIVNGTTSAVSFVSVCHSPRKLAIDTSQPKLFVLCSESDSISAITLNASGSFVSQTLLATDKYPSAMALDAGNNRLYVTNLNSNTVLSLNATTNALVSRATVHEQPYDVELNTATNTISIGHQSSRYITQITSAGTQSDIDVGNPAFSDIAVNPTSDQLYALSRSLSPALFFYPALSLTVSGTTLTANSYPLNISIDANTSKAYITVPSANAISIDAESGTKKDVAVGTFPVFALPVSSVSKVYVSNFLSDSVSMVSTTTDAVVGTLSVTTGCGPTKMSMGSVGGTLFLYVLCQSNDSLEVINTGTNGRTTVSLRIPN
jgi:DNA-binding beta-propeller fold protein YncE